MGEVVQCDFVYGSWLRSVARIVLVARRCSCCQKAKVEAKTNAEGAFAMLFVLLEVFVRFI